jgi:hypothetical protein
VLTLMGLARRPDRMRIEPPLLSVEAIDGVKLGWRGAVVVGGVPVVAVLTPDWSTVRSLVVLWVLCVLEVSRLTGVVIG